jgi:acyl-lipid omega-6 desaturase (Delta-12 desaturase)
MSPSFAGLKPEYNSAPWLEVLARYHSPRLGKSIWQIVNSIVPYLALWVLAYFSLKVSYLLTLALAIPMAGFLIRIFIIFHDCVHDSFFKSHSANDTLGIVTGILTYTPYYQWKKSHKIHHDTAGDLDQRGVGDVWTMTSAEYLASSPGKRLAYRLYRNPLVMFILGPIYVVLIGNRLPKKGMDRKELISIHLTNLALAGLLILISQTIGLKDFLLILLPVNVVGFAAGFWLFYVQHQFEGVYWEEHQEWDFISSAMKGSSFYKLPKILQWFTGRIGYHHIHHLCPRIPNYYLAKCYSEHPMFQEIEPITLTASFKSLSFRLWDQETNRLVGFSHLRKLRKSKAVAGQV